jgi:hypothetical protein
MTIDIYGPLMTTMRASGHLGTNSEFVLIIQHRQDRDEGWPQWDVIVDR